MKMRAVVKAMVYCFNVSIWSSLIFTAIFIQLIYVKLRMKTFNCWKADKLNKFWETSYGFECRYPLLYSNFLSIGLRTVSIHISVKNIHIHTVWSIATAHHRGNENTPEIFSLLKKNYLYICSNTFSCIWIMLHA